MAIEQAELFYAQCDKCERCFGFSADWAELSDYASTAFDAHADALRLDWKEIGGLLVCPACSEDAGLPMRPWVGLGVVPH